ncbi:transcription activator of gluconeogenesis ERT1 [Amanita rubescens]|nr:transcription activator of gluconeogenesis ERT1 [Amanita rubescens]
MSAAAVYPTFVSPAQMQNAHAGPSSPPSNKKKLPQSVKRKRMDTPDDSTPESATPPRKARDGPKKKKANRACFHCQKAHLTCDDCHVSDAIKRGIANNCTEGHRKKAKYLLDDEELEQLKRSKSSTSTSPSTSEQPPAPPASSLSADPFSQNDPLLSSSFDPATFAFDSEVAGLEYSILSAILGNPSPPASETSPPPQQQPYPSWSSDPVDFTTSPKLSGYASSYSDTQISSLPLKSTLTAISSGGPPYLAYGYTQQRSEDIELQYQSQYSSNQPPDFTSSITATPRSPHGDAYISGKDAVTSNTGLLSPAPSNASPTAATSVPLAVAADLSVSSRSKLQNINDRVTRPYDYTEGYHFLMKHLPNRFEKDDILRIVRALAIFRPSLIALQMPLSRDDEVFVEKCFQRTLLEMEKLITFSGTPTVVWRRTGEICLVAPEFCMLTDWPLEELVGRKKFIYELFENQSVVEYWENFATHAFENTTQSVYSHCVLLKPNGAPVPSSFCFSVRRDLFDLPSMVIGM